METAVTERLRSILVLLNIGDATFLITDTFYWVFSTKARLRWYKKADVGDNSYRHKRLIRREAIFETRRGNSIASIPFKIILYVFMGSEPEKGGLQSIEMPIRQRTSLDHLLSID